MKKNILIGGIVFILILVAGGYYWCQSNTGKNFFLAYTFQKQYTANHADAFRSALPTRIAENIPADWEFYYENRDDQADYSESIYIGAEESYIKIATGGKITKSPITISPKTRTALYQALRSIPFDGIKVDSLPLLDLPKQGEIVIGGEKKEIKTKQETMRLTYGSGVVDRNNFLIVDGVSTKIAEQSMDNWNMAKNLALKALQTFKK
jgi:hypothetical protein